MTGDENTESLAPERNEGGGSWKGGVNVTLLTKAEDREGEGGLGGGDETITGSIKLHTDTPQLGLSTVLTVSSKSSTFHLLSRVRDALPDQIVCFF